MVQLLDYCTMYESGEDRDDRLLRICKFFFNRIVLKRE